MVHLHIGLDYVGALLVSIHFAFICDCNMSGDRRYVCCLIIVKYLDARIMAFILLNLRIVKERIQGSSKNCLCSKSLS